MVAVIDWILDTPARGPWTAGQASQAGRMLARTHRTLAKIIPTGWTSAPEIYRRLSTGDLTARLQRLAGHIDTRPETALTRRHRDQVQRRIELAARLDELRSTLPTPRVQPLHGDYTRPNLLFDGDTLVGVIDPRPKVGDPVTEVGRAAFDPQTVAADPAWRDAATAFIHAYFAEGGTAPRDQLHYAARLALLRTLTSTYPLENHYLDPDPVVQDSLDDYWDQRCALLERLLPELADVEADLADLTAGRPRTRRVLVTGVSATGKTTLARRLRERERGHHAISLDSVEGLCFWADDHGLEVSPPEYLDHDWLTTHSWRWRPHVLDEMLADTMYSSEPVVYYCGTAANQRDLADGSTRSSRSKSTNPPCSPACTAQRAATTLCPHFGVPDWRGADSGRTSAFRRPASRSFGVGAAASSALRIGCRSR